MHEFPAIISGLKERTECFETWCKNVAKIVDRTQPKCLLQEVQVKNNIYYFKIYVIKGTFLYL